jgi:hypothetical protein
VALKDRNGYIPLWDHEVAVFGLQQGLSHEVFIHFSGAFPSFTDGPDDEWLSSAHVSAAEDPGDIGFKWMPEDFLRF